MAAASSSRARAGPPCEKSQLSVKGGSCRLAEAGRPGTCGGIADFGCIWSWRVHCLHSILGMASAALCPPRGTEQPLTGLCTSSPLGGGSGAASMLPWPRDGSRRLEPRPLEPRPPELCPLEPRSLELRPRCVLQPRMLLPWGWQGRTQRVPLPRGSPLPPHLTHSPGAGSCLWRL